MGRAGIPASAKESEPIKEQKPLLNPKGLQTRRYSRMLTWAFTKTFLVGAKCWQVFD